MLFENCLVIRDPIWVSLCCARGSAPDSKADLRSSPSRRSQCGTHPRRVIRPGGKRPLGSSSRDHESGARSAPLGQYRGPVSARDDEDDIFIVDPTEPPRRVDEMFEVLPDRDYGPQWTPLNTRLHVLRQTRYALNYRALHILGVPPEGPFDVALTNALLAIVGHADPHLTVQGSRTLPASSLLGVIEGMQAAAIEDGTAPLMIDVPVLRDALELTQPLRHGRADDEWVILPEAHLDALRALDDVEGLGVLDVADQIFAGEASSTSPDTRLALALFKQRVEEHPSREMSSVDDALLMPMVGECDSCWRESFIPDGIAEGEASSGMCVICGYAISAEEGWAAYELAEFQRRWDKD
jgi:hypothetical protein